MTKKEYVIRQVSALQEYESAGINDIEKTTDIFFKVLDFKIANNKLDGVGERVNSCLNSLMSSIDFDQLLQALTTINLTEVYARKVLYLVDPKKLEDLEEGKKGCFQVLKRLGFSDNQATKMSDRRNVEGDHEANPLAPMEIYARISRFLLDYLKITNIKLSELTEIVVEPEEDTFFPQKYILNVIDEYESQKNFDYMDVHWHGDKENSVDCNISSLLDNKKIWNNEQTFGVKFLGEAGTGKTTALRRIQWSLAKRYVENKGGRIPIYVLLNELGAEQSPLTNKIMDITHKEREEVEKSLGKGEFILLLDGFNEILDTSRQKNLAREIDTYYRVYYDKTQIYISDRTVGAVRYMTDSYVLFLRELSLGEKLDFIEKKVSSDCFELVKNKARENERYFDQLDTPLKIGNFIDVVSNQNAIPEDITESYIQMLFEREAEENKEDKMDEIKDLLYALAIYIYQSESEDESDGEPSIDRVVALKTIADVKRVLGYSIDPERFQRVVKGMRILNWENNSVSFANREYLSYFMNEGIENKIDEII